MCPRETRTRWDHTPTGKPANTRRSRERNGSVRETAILRASIALSSSRDLWKAARRKALARRRRYSTTTKPESSHKALVATIVCMSANPRHRTVAVNVGGVKVGGGNPIVVQSMTNTDTADVQSTVNQVMALANAGSELVRVTVNTEDAAAAVPKIVETLDMFGVRVPIIGDFHYNGHILLKKYP